MWWANRIVMHNYNIECDKWTNHYSIVVWCYSVYCNNIWYGDALYHAMIYYFGKWNHITLCANNVFMA